MDSLNHELRAAFAAMMLHVELLDLPWCAYTSSDRDFFELHEDLRHIAESLPDEADPDDICNAWYEAQEEAADLAS